MIKAWAIGNIIPYLNSSLHNGMPIPTATYMYDAIALFHIITINSLLAK